MAEEINPIVGRLFDFANAFATPFAKSLAESSTSRESQQRVATQNLNETVRYSMLNGSGPNDPALAAQSAPTTLQNFINGTGTTAQTKTGGNQQILFIAVFALLAVLALSMYKRGL